MLARHLYPLFPLAALLALAGPREAQAQDKVVPAEEVKAQMLLNFPLVIEWPAGHRPPEAQVRFCTLGEEDDVSDQMKQLLMGELGSRNVLQPSVSPDQLAACDVLFVSSRACDSFRRLRGDLDRLPVLTVGEGWAFLKAGGMISFVPRVKKLGVFSRETVGFQVNPSAIRARNLVLDPMLLEIADRILEEGA
jgi:hypothetical protein